MVFRIAGLVTLAAALLMVLWIRSAAPPVQAQQVVAQASRPAALPTSPPPMFSPWYGESLRGVLTLEPADVTLLERQVAAHPDDFPARLKLLAYYRRADRAERPEDLARRIQHTLWLIQHHPDSEILHSYVAHFSPGDLPADTYQAVVHHWQSASEMHPHDARILWNAATFFEGLDPALHLSYLEATAAADPNHPFALRPLAALYASSILEPGGPSLRAQSALDRSQNVWVLGNAAYTLQSLYNASVQQGSPNHRAAQLAERYYLRAQAIDRNLDRNVILPQLPSTNAVQSREDADQARRAWQTRFAKAEEEIRRLPPEAFPELPATIANVLRARNCTIPQPNSSGPPLNVIRGEFFAKGQTAWAALCSVKQSTALLVFHNDDDSHPDLLNQTEDRAYLQQMEQDRIVYSRQITPVNRTFMIGNYRAFGGPQPPPIDHQGIDDAFLEKASITLYFHSGKWLSLQGAD